MKVADKIKQVLKEFDPNKHRVREEITMNFNSLNGESDYKQLIPKGNEELYLRIYLSRYEEQGHLAWFDEVGTGYALSDVELVEKESLE